MSPTSDRASPDARFKKRKGRRPAPTGSTAELQKHPDLDLPSIATSTVTSTVDDGPPCAGLCREWAKLGDDGIALWLRAGIRDHKNLDAMVAAAVDELRAHGASIEQATDYVTAARTIAERMHAHITRPDPVGALLFDSGVTGLGDDPERADVDNALRCLADALKDADRLTRESARQAAVKHLRTRKIDGATRLVDAALHQATTADRATGQGRALALEDPEPYPEAVDGIELLDELTGTVRAYVVLVKGAAEAAALWVLHTHVLPATFISPLLVATSPQPRCGKTTLLEVLRALVRRPLLASNVTPAALFRTVEAAQPTLLIDEADTFARENEELRGILNAGHTRTGAQVIRIVGDDHEPRTFDVFGAKALAAIGRLPATIEDRAIMVHMKRRAPGEPIERLRRDRIHGLCERLRRQAARWAQDNVDALREADPETPSDLNDRAADNWRPLLAIADRAGGEWPERARRAALSLIGSGTDDGTTGAMLLADLRDLFDTHGERLDSDTVAAELAKLETRPWREWKAGKPLSVIQLARLLKPFGIQPGQLWIDGKKTRGYERIAFEDAFVRYLRVDTQSDPVEPVEPLRDKGQSWFSDPVGAERPTDSKKAIKPLCDKVPTDSTGSNGRDGQEEPFFDDARVPEANVDDPDAGHGEPVPDLVPLNELFDGARMLAPVDPYALDDLDPTIAEWLVGLPSESK